MLDVTALVHTADNVTNCIQEVKAFVWIELYLEKQFEKKVN